MSEVCLLSHMCMLSLVLLAVFSASINNDILFSIYLLFNTFIIINILHFICKISLFVFHFLIQISNHIFEGRSSLFNIDYLN
jgi:hypothetical protein